MAEPPSQSPAQTPPQQQHPQGPGESARDDMMACVAALEAAMLPCLPARELQAVDRSLQSSHQIDVERHARDFMEAAKKLQSYFISLQREDRPTTEEMLRKDIATMEEELKTKSELIAKHKKLIEGWQKELKDQLGKHVTELERV
ncbi:mediator of RNA polymerase II transcription subunit 28 [Oryza brachyantha]|uniref:Mediator of RNA polymerase II transcription subunit 28 n=1 Tax=Oryza brachyantha TaxID=4533 RepID=J3M435_ORYBR|nr:mediator of RNA polymerase II transcription subunit 28 [Oryza brachyantha]